MKLLEITQSKGGYWITPTGRVEPVGFQQHLAWLRHLSPPIIYYDEAFVAGYIKIGFSNQPRVAAEITIEGELERTKEDTDKIMKIVKEYNPETLTVIIYKKSGNSMKDFYWSGDRGKLIRFLKTGS